MAPEQIAKNGNEQPEPNNEYEYCEGIHQKVSISKSLLKEEHCDPLGSPSLRADQGYLGLQHVHPA